MANPEFALTELSFRNMTNASIDAFVRMYQDAPLPVGENTYKRRLLEYYLMGIGAMFVCVFGVVANILSIVVLTRRIMNSSTYSYLTALSVCDLLVLVCTMVIYMDDTSRPVENSKEWDHSPLHANLFPVVHPLAIMFQVTSIWLTLAFTVDRYIMICHPFKAESMCNKARARKVVAVICLMGLLYNIPRFFEYKTKVIDLDNNGTTRVTLDLTETGRSDIYRQVIHQWMYLVFVYAVPFVMLAISNGYLILAVHRSRRRGREINVAERRRNDTTVMLISVVVIFFICHFPALINNIIYATQPASMFSFPMVIFQEVGNLLVILNSAINIIPYYFFGKKFRRQFYRLFCCCFLSAERIQTLTRSTSYTVYERRGSEYSNNTVLTDTRLNAGVRRTLLNKVFACDCVQDSPASRALPSSPTYIQELNGNIQKDDDATLRVTTDYQDAVTTGYQEAVTTGLQRNDCSEHGVEMSLLNDEPILDDRDA